MKKLIILPFLVLSISCYTQNFFKNRITLDYTANINLSPGKNYELKNENLLNFIDNEFNLNIRIQRKVSMELIGGYKTFNFRNEYYYHNNGGNTSVNYNYKLNFNEITYGLGFNFHYGRNYSPIGNSIGLFFKVNNYLVEDYNLYYAFLQSIEKDTYATNTTINYQVVLLGIKLNFIGMLSNKIPLYIKYGASLAMPVNSQIFDASYSKSSFSTYARGLNDREALSSLTRMDFYKIFVGFGYMF